MNMPPTGNFPRGARHFVVRIVSTSFMVTLVMIAIIAGYEFIEWFFSGHVIGSIVLIFAPLILLNDKAFRTMSKVEPYLEQLANAITYPVRAPLRATYHPDSTFHVYCEMVFSLAALPVLFSARLVQAISRPLRNSLLTTEEKRPWGLDLVPLAHLVRDSYLDYRHGGNVNGYVAWEPAEIARIHTRFLEGLSPAQHDQAALFVRRSSRLFRNTQSGQTILIFVGTVRFTDWLINLRVTHAHLNGDYLFARHFTRTVAKELSGKTNQSLLVMGHSKGGGMAAYAFFSCFPDVADFEMKCLTFNPAGLPLSEHERFGGTRKKHISCDSVRCYSMCGDLVSNFAGSRNASAVYQSPSIFAAIFDVPQIIPTAPTVINHPSDQTFWGRLNWLGLRHSMDFLCEGLEAAIKSDLRSSQKSLTVN